MSATYALSLTLSQKGEGMNNKTRPDPQYRERVYKIVRRIPRGQVMTYGQIAYMLGEGYTPRTVGFVMHGADESNTPWHRVINSQGKCSTGRVVLPSDKQQRMLEREGVKFDKTGRCDLETFIWNPRRKTGTKTAKARHALYGK
jgi:methylated-DNA-protein-cysteine methyltransferase-like protein